MPQTYDPDNITIVIGDLTFHGLSSELEIKYEEGATDNIKFEPKEDVGLEFIEIEKQINYK